MSDHPAARPALRPALRWARWALVLLCLFAFLRGGLFAATTPSFWGPDEDYHMMYVDHVAKSGTIIDPDKPLYSPEYVETINRTQFNAYGVGPRTDFSGAPKHQLHVLAHLPKDNRDQIFTGRDPQVVHAPLYYYGGAAFDAVSRVFGGTALPTRMLWVRIWSSLLGALAVFAAWLLASQVFAGQRRALLVALLVATQPMISYWSGLVSNDIAVIATYTLGMAMLAFLLRTSPDRRQGWWLGGIIAVAILTKSTALGLFPLAVLALLGQGLAFRGTWREIRATILRAGAVFVVPLLGWYIWSKVAYGTFTGEVLVGGVASSNPGGLPSHFGLHDYYVAARAWFADIYRTGWFHFMTYEAPRGKFVYYWPGIVIILGALGAAGFAATTWRRLFARDDARLRQALLCLAACVVLTVPFLRLDLSRASQGLGFLVNGGRFLLPAYASLAVICVLGLDFLISRAARRVAFGALAIGSGLMLWYVWHIHFVARYYGNGSWSQRFHDMSFDRPWFVVPGTYWAWLALIVVSFAAFAWVVLRGEDAGRLPRLPRRRGRERVAQA